MLCVSATTTYVSRRMCGMWIICILNYKAPRNVKNIGAAEIYRKVS